MKRYTALLTMVPFVSILPATPSVEVPRLVRLRTHSPYREWLGDVVPEDGAKRWVASQTEKHPRDHTFDYLPVSDIITLRGQVTRLSEPLPSRDTGLEQMAAKIDAWGLEWEWSRIVDGALVDIWNPGKQKGALAAVRAGHTIRRQAIPYVWPPLPGKAAPREPEPPDLCVELSSKNESMLHYLASILEGSGEVFEKVLAPCPCGFICPIFIYTGLRLSPEALDRLGDKIENRMLELIVLPDSLAAQLGDAWLVEAAIVLAADTFLDAARGRSLKKEEGAQA